MNIFDLPPVNATLNGLSTCLIAAGWSAIRRDRKRVACMVTALVCSTVFLSCYLTYHFGLLSSVGEGSVKFTADGWVRPVYYIILVTHLILAFTILPLVIITVIPALRARFDRHRKLGRFTMPIWLVDAGSQSDVTATKSSSSSMSLEGRGFYRPWFARCKGLLAVTFKDRGRRRKESLQLDRILLVFVAALALVSCNNDKIEVYRIPKEGVTVAMENGSAGLPPAPASNPAKWVKPEGWSEQPLSEMRLGSFKVDGSNAASADVSVTAFPGDAGGLAPNVNRWRGQLQLPPLEEDQLQQTIQRTEVEGVQTYLVDIQTPDNAAKPSRILGAVLETPDRTWFVKMTGSPELIESQRQKFLDFVKSFRFTSAIAGQVPETAGANMPKSTNDK